jgi:predicted deacylase
MTDVTTIPESPVLAEIELRAPGKHFGRLRVPASTNTSGWASIYIPVVSVIGGEGATGLVLGGTHGDEPEGQVAALRLARVIEPADVHGRLIIIPCLSPDASREYTRLWPSGANLNRSFPGSPEGTPDLLLADYLSRYLFPISDVVVDMHSGGRSTLCLPWSEMHLVPNREQRRAMIDAMLAWNTDYHVIYIDIAGSGLLVGEAERQGKIVVSTELGGGGHVTAEVHRIAYDGLTNVLRHLGLLEGEVQHRRSPGLILRATDLDDYLLAPESGFFEIRVRLGDRVEPDQLVGQIHFLERPDRPPEPVVARTAGIVCSIRAIAPTRIGDCVAVVAQEVDRQTLEEEEL